MDYIKDYQNLINKCRQAVEQNPSKYPIGNSLNEIRYEQASDNQKIIINYDSRLLSEY